MLRSREISGQLRLAVVNSEQRLDSNKVPLLETPKLLNPISPIFGFVATSPLFPLNLRKLALHFLFFETI